MKKLKAEMLKAERGAGESVGELVGRGVLMLNKTQMAAALQVSVRTLNRMMERGEIAYYKIGGKLVRFRVEEAFKRMDETVLVAEDTDFNHEIHETHERGGQNHEEAES